MPAALPSSCTCSSPRTSVISLSAGVKRSGPNPSNSEVRSHNMNMGASYTVGETRGPQFGADGRTIDLYTQRAQRKEVSTYRIQFRLLAACPMCRCLPPLFGITIALWIECLGSRTTGKRALQMQIASRKLCRLSHTPFPHLFVVQPIGGQWQVTNRYVFTCYAIRRSCSSISGTSPR